MKKNFTLFKVSKIINGFFILIVVIITLSPAIFTLFNSFFGRREIAEIYGEILGNSQGTKNYIGFSIIPYEISFDQYTNLFLFRPEYLQMYLNSIVITLPIVFGQVAVASFAAYSFAKMRFPFRDALFFIYIIVMLMPYQVTLVPNYIMMDKLGWIGSFKSIVLPGIFNTFGVFLLRQYIHMIPNGYIEAAKIDGAGPIRIFLSIILPQCKSALASLIVLTFVDNWNMVEQPIIMLSDEKKYPFSLLLAYISEKDFTLAFASGVIYMIPVICFAIFFHSYLIKGIQLSGMK